MADKVKETVSALPLMAAILEQVLREAEGEEVSSGQAPDNSLAHPLVQKFIDKENATPETRRARNNQFVRRLATFERFLVACNDAKHKKAQTSVGSFLDDALDNDGAFLAGFAAFAVEYASGFIKLEVDYDRDADRYFRDLNIACSVDVERHMKSRERKEKLGRKRILVCTRKLATSAVESTRPYVGSQVPHAGFVHDRLVFAQPGLRPLTNVELAAYAEHCRKNPSVLGERGHAPVVAYNRDTEDRRTVLIFYRSTFDGAVHIKRDKTLECSGQWLPADARFLFTPGRSPHFTIMVERIHPTTEEIVKPSPSRPEHEEYYSSHLDKQSAFPLSASWSERTGSHDDSMDIDKGSAMHSYRDDSEK